MLKLDKKTFSQFKRTKYQEITSYSDRLKFLRVPLSYIKLLKIERNISNDSFMSDKYVYLSNKSGDDRIFLENLPYGINESDIINNTENINPTDKCFFDKKDIYNHRYI
jgi:hypothetical protein